MEENGRFPEHIILLLNVSQGKSAFGKKEHTFPISTSLGGVKLPSQFKVGFAWLLPEFYNDGPPDLFLIFINS